MLDQGFSPKPGGYMVINKNLKTTINLKGREVLFLTVWDLIQEDILRFWIVIASWRFKPVRGLLKKIEGLRNKNGSDLNEPNPFLFYGWGTRSRTSIHEVTKRQELQGIVRLNKLTKILRIYKILSDRRGFLKCLKRNETCRPRIPHIFTPESHQHFHLLFFAEYRNQESQFPLLPSSQTSHSNSLPQRLLTKRWRCRAPINLPRMSSIE
jgi:hypothetical protein